MAQTADNREDSQAVVVESSDDEDLWNYGKAASEDDAKGPDEGPITIDNDTVDDLDMYLPEHKRAKLAHQRRPTNQTIDDDILVIDDSDDEKEKKTNKPEPPANRRVAADDDDWLEADVQLYSSDRVPTGGTGLDPALEEILRKNSEAMESLEKASKEATVTLGDLEEEEPEVVVVAEELQPEEEEDLPVVSKDTDAAEKVQLCVRCGQGKEVQLRMKKNDPFQKLMDRFRSEAAEKGWLKEGASVKFVFDGEVLQPSATPASLDCEDEDVIDAYC